MSDRGIPLAEGIRMILDGHYRFIRSGLRVYLRVQNFPDSGAYQEMGGTLPASADQGGYTDILVDPPPQVTAISMHNIGMSGGKLRLGARSFKVPHTFVLNMRARYINIPDDQDVFFNWDGVSKVVGFVYENMMHDIVTYSESIVGGEPVTWTLLCNRVDLPLDQGAQILPQP